MTAVKQEPNQPLSTANIITKMVEIRDERRKLSSRDKELIGEWNSLELELLTRLNEQEMEKVTTPSGTASINETVLPQVTDWDEFYGYISENDAFYLLQKRPAAAAYRELNESGQSVPGVEPYTKKSIGLRKK